MENAEKISQADFLRLVHAGCAPQCGDVLFSKDGTVGKVATVRVEGFVCLSSLAILRPKRLQTNQGFLRYFLESPEGKQQVHSYYVGAALRRITLDAIREIGLPVPDHEEQRAIARFLDYETARIDALIAKQERLIELLKEKRQAVISHAVTKGLNPDAPMKDSGVEWLGAVPAHWIVGPVKRFMQNEDFRRIPLSTVERGERQGEFPYYGASGVIDHVDDFLWSEPRVLVSEDGANLVMRSSPIAFVARGKYWVNNHAHIYAPFDGLCDYWALVVDAADISTLVSGSAQPKLTAEAAGAIQVACPPSFQERRAIIDHVARTLSTLLQADQLARSQIRLLRERRTALISAAVTGKIDVRNWQPPEEQAA